MEAMNNKEKSGQSEDMHRLFILIGALVTIWLWVSWLRGWFPFSSSQTTTASEETMQQIPKSVIDSLTAPADAPVDNIPQSVIDSLTAPAESSSVPDLRIL